MNIEILKIGNPKWNDYFNDFPSKLRDPFFCSGYYALENTTAECFVCTEGDNIFFYPFIKTNIKTLGYELDRNYYDIQGVYGYNGALVKDDTDKGFIDRARIFFLQYVQNEDIVSEFTRFNPLYNNHTYFKDLQPICVNKNIIVDLKREDIWMDSYEHSTRKNVKKAIRNNLEYKVVDAKNISKNDMEAFLHIYTATMKRNNADSEYFFKQDYFYAIKNKLSENALFIFIYKEGLVISVELVILNKYIAYSFLGGTLKEYFKFRPNDYLKHILIKTLKQRGLSFFMLGGGESLDDGIFKYKRNFSKNGVCNFYIGKLIHDEEVYNTIIRQWEDKVDLKTQEKYSNHLLKYHYGVDV